MSFKKEDVEEESAIAEFYNNYHNNYEPKTKSTYLPTKRVLEEIEGIRTLLPLQERILKVWILAILDDLVREIK